MLNIYADNCKEPLPKEFESHVSEYFDEVFEEDWFLDNFVKSIIKEIDKSEVIGEDRSINIYNKFLGNFPSQHLSSGCKALILLYRDDIKINGDRLGDNCMDLLLRIADKKDITISLSHMPPFPDKFEAYIINTNKFIKTNKEFHSEMMDVRFGGCC